MLFIYKYSASIVKEWKTSAFLLSFLMHCHLHLIMYCGEGDFLSTLARPVFAYTFIFILIFVSILHVIFSSE